MERVYHTWWSPSLGREMEMLIFGNGGVPVLAFPTSMGRFFEWEDFGMIDSLSYQLENGHNTVYCIDSVDNESFHNKVVDPYVRIMRHRQYDDFIRHEVIPYIEENSSNPYIISAGCNFGSYHALNVALKYPHKIGKVITMGGQYDIRSFLDEFFDDNVYYNNPGEYLPNLNDERLLKEIRNLDIRLVCGEHDNCLPENENMSKIMDNKDIPHILDIWKNTNGHDWETWKKMIASHIV